MLCSRYALYMDMHNIGQVDKQGSREQAGRAEDKESEREQRREIDQDSIKARDNTLQELSYRQWPRGCIRGQEPLTRINKVVQQQQLPFFLLVHY